MAIIPLLALALFPQQAVSPPSSGRIDATPKPPNILIVIADDFGVDQVGAYGEGNAACTPNIDRLASEGLLFRNAWTNPVCTPSRASLLTGRYAFRVGVGTPGRGAVLDVNELTIPDALPDYASAIVGKWHLGGQDASHPNQVGFDYYAGGLGGAVDDYFSWSKTTNGVTVPSTTYATTDTANEAIQAIRSLPQPWFLVVSFNAPHTPYHEPPIGLCSNAGCQCANLPANPSNFELGRAMIEAMDAEFGRVLRVVDEESPSAYVFFLGDNGSARQIVSAPFNSQRAKGSPYEGGVNVPLLVRGPRVPVGESVGLVSSVDFFATVTELAGQAASTEDSVSMLPYFSNPHANPRALVFAESFEPNGFGPYTKHDRSVREVRYKLIRQIGAPDEFYDLLLDPFEAANLFPNLNLAEQATYDQLLAELVRLGID
jgi:arylsulfatase B